MIKVLQFSSIVHAELYQNFQVGTGELLADPADRILARDDEGAAP